MAITMTINNPYLMNRAHRETSTQGIVHEMRRSHRTVHVPAA